MQLTTVLFNAISNFQHHQCLLLLVTKLL